MDSYDVIIIGTGAGGGTLARHLAPSGKKILMLERGDWLPRELENWVTEDVFVDNRYVSPETLVRRRQADPSSRGSTTSSEVRRSSTAPRSTASARRTSGSSATTMASHRPGRSPTTKWSRTTRSPSSCTRCTAPAAMDPTEPPASAPVSAPAGLARAADPAALGRPRRCRLPPVPRALRDHARRGAHAFLEVRPLRDLRRLPLPRPRQVRRRGARACVPPSNIRTSR